LVPSQFNGTIGTLNASGQTFTETSLNGLFVGNSIPLVTVDTGTGTTFTGVTGFNGLAAGNETNGAACYSKRPRDLCSWVAKWA
jgi:hypothetical protein